MAIPTKYVPLKKGPILVWKRVDSNGILYRKPRVQSSISVKHVRFQRDGFLLLLSQTVGANERVKLCRELA